MSSSKGFGLILKKQTSSSDASKPRGPVQVASIFNEDSDDEDIKNASASDRFDHKYGNLKAKDQREQEKVLAEDPTAYEYDSVYDEAQRKKNEKTEQQLQADAEKKPKYADKLVIAHKKRELEKLLHDENTYKKEREKEAGEFEDKEIYVTGAYKKQIEERNKFREEIEQSDAMDALTKVSDQSLWQQAFNRKLLDDRSRTSDTQPAASSATDTKPELAVKTEPAEEPTSTQLKTTTPLDAKTKLSQAAAKPKEVKPSIYSSDEEEIPPKEKTPPKKFDELKPGLNMPRLKQEPKSSTSRHSNERDQRREDSRDRTDNRLDRKDRNGKHEEWSGKRDEKPRLKNPTDEIQEELSARMEKVREIMKQKSTAEDIEEAKKRYFQRLAESSVTLPV